LSIMVARSGLTQASQAGLAGDRGWRATSAVVRPAAALGAARVFPAERKEVIQ